VTVLGSNFGVGASFTLRLRGPGNDAGHCDFAWDEGDLHTSAGGSNPAGDIFVFEQGRLKFVSPVGQCDVSMALTLTVAGQPSLQTLALAFAPPAIGMLSKDGATPLGSDCDRSSEAGCGLLTSGGYTLTLTGENFGVDDRQVWFNGQELEASAVAFNGHTEAAFQVPAGAGARVPVAVVVGGRRSLPTFFSYDPPFVTSFTPNEFDAEDAGEATETLSIANAHRPRFLTSRLSLACVGCLCVVYSFLFYNQSLRYTAATLGPRLTTRATLLSASGTRPAPPW
jgi:hypothetical protein